MEIWRWLNESGLDGGVVTEGLGVANGGNQ